MSTAIQAVRKGCIAADVHLTCSYPECSCTVVPAAIQAALNVDEYERPILTVDVAMFT